MEDDAAYITEDADSPKASARELSKARHARRLMDAARTAIHRYGIRGATIDRIQELSGLSRGLINTRFKSKENLLEETVRAMSADYTAMWQNALENAGPDPAAQLRALLVSDFSERALNAPNMSVWFAFRAEAQSRATYLELISTRENAFTAALRDICLALAKADGQSPADGQKAARLLAATLEGLWIDFHLYPDAFRRDDAIALCWHMMARMFPCLSDHKL